MAKNISIEYAYEGFFDGCDNMEGVDESATIDNWENAVVKQLEAEYPGADIEIRQIRSGYGKVEVDDRDDTDDASNVRAVMNNAFADADIWVSE